MIQRRWAVVMACVVIAPAVAYGYSQTQEKQYQASATILVRDPSDTAALAGAEGPNPSYAAMAVNTDISVAALNVVAEKTAKALGRQGLPGSVSTNNDGASNLLTVTATERGPILAADVANAYARQYIIFQTGTNLAHIATEQADLTRDLRHPGPNASAAAASLTQSIPQLATLASLQNANMQAVSAATPSSSPSSPKTNQIVAAGAGVGLFLGILLAVVISQFDRRLWSSRDVDEIFRGWSVLGTIPRSRLVADVGSATPGNLGVVEQEPFAMLYANLVHCTDGQVTSVLVTSATGGEGRSTVALNLAHAAACAGAEVLLIEADLRHPTLASRVGVETNGDPGLLDFLARDVSLTEVIHQIPLDADSVGQADQDHEARVGRGQPAHEVAWEEAHGPIPNGFTLVHRNGDHDDNWLQNLQLVRTDGLVAYSQSTDIVPFTGDRDGSNGRMNHIDIVFAGRLDGSAESGRMNRLGLLASDDMRNMILAAERTYDLIVIDTPPMSVVSDAIPLMKYVGGVLVVSRVQQDTRDSARRVRDQLSNLRVRTLGVVVNGVQPTEGHRNRNSPRFAAS